jgi:hypothetical protein
MLHDGLDDPGGFVSAHGHERHYVLAAGRFVSLQVRADEPGPNARLAQSVPGGAAGK